VKYERYDTLIFETTGREIYANGGQVGLGPLMERVSEGSDGDIETFYEYEEKAIFTPVERRELADYMKELWERYAVEGLSDAGR